MNTKRTKRLNWTGRISIDKSSVSVTRENVADGQPESVIIELDLSEYSFPKSALVTIEASDLLTSMRFDFGTIGEMVTSMNVVLSEFPSQNLPTIRLLVVDSDIHPGKLLGSAERIKIGDTETSEESRNIFKVDSRNLGEEVWRVEFELDDYPKLIINRNITNLLYLLEHDQAVQGMIIPIAFRVVLNDLARNLRNTINDSGEDSWVSVWLQFCNELCGAEDPRHFADDEDRLKSWIEECVIEFANLHSFATILKKRWEN